MICPTRYILIIGVLLQSTHILSQEPRNITRTEGETDVFFPCPFEGPKLTPSIWRINGTDYSVATLPSIYSLSPGGLFINTVHKCLDQTSFQCVDTTSSMLAGQESNIGILTVTLTSRDKCTREELESFLSADIRAIELDHRQMVYGQPNTTLAWKIDPKLSNNCSVTQILSHSECQQSNPSVDITTSDMSITVASDSLQLSTGKLADFNISSLGDLQTRTCPKLSETVRLNVTETETINLLLGNNNCTCVEMDCQGGLNVAISNPDPNQLDIVCPVYADTCYSPEKCNGFNDTSYFNICEQSSESSECKYKLCFGNISEKLNNSRLDFYVSERSICQETLTLYYARKYIKSLEIQVERASADISINVTSGEICFSSSSLDCNLTQFTQYNVSIIDSSGNVIFRREDISESSCVIVSELLIPNLSPFVMTTQPYNDYIVYTSVTQMIGSAHTVLTFINNTPRVKGNSITADIHYNQPVRSLRCALTGQPLKECSNGSVTFTKVSPRNERNSPYVLRIVAVSMDGKRTINRRLVRPEEEEFCLVHLVNDGVVVSGNSLTIEFTGVGKVKKYFCDLDRKGLKPCSSSYSYHGLSAGRHRVKVVPSFYECGEKRRSLVIHFTVK